MSRANNPLHSIPSDPSSTALPHDPPNPGTSSRQTTIAPKLTRSPLHPANSGLVSTVPIYLSEISAPSQRGLIGGISGCGISFGTMMSNWVGMACGYAPYGAVQWRLPLALQIPWGVILFVGLATFMPNSPRQLIRQGRPDEAQREFARIRRDLQALEVQEEFVLMKSQIEFEMEREIRSYSEIFRLFRRRAFVCVYAYARVLCRLAVVWDADPR